MDVPPNLGGPRRVRRRTDQLKKQRMASDGPTCVGETLAARLAREDLCEFGGIETTELDFLDDTTEDHVPSVVERDGPTGQAEDVRVGNLNDEVLEGSKERKQLR